MDAIDKLLAVIDHLMGPGGCPWDQNQTLASMRESLIEESSEVVEAINLAKPGPIAEELGDLLFNALFLCRLAQKEQIASLHEIAEQITAKLIHRHPHIFKQSKNMSESEALDQWQKIKESEKQPKSNPFAEIPKSLPALAYALKFLKVCEKKHYLLKESTNPDAEEAVGAELLNVVKKARTLKVDPEQALRKWVQLREHDLHKD